MRIRAMIMLASTLMLVVTGLAGLGAGAASAGEPAPGAGIEGGSCIEPFCSKTWNYSSLGVYVGKDWQCSGTTGTRGGENCVAANPRMWIYNGERSPWGQDWDAFRVDAGWCYKVTFTLPYDQWTEYINQSGTGAVWVKVENHGMAFVYDQRYGSCPP